MISLNLLNENYYTLQQAKKSLFENLRMVASCGKSAENGEIFKD